MQIISFRDDVQQWPVNCPEPLFNLASASRLRSPPQLWALIIVTTFHPTSDGPGSEHTRTHTRKRTHTHTHTHTHRHTDRHSVSINGQTGYEYKSSNISLTAIFCCYVNISKLSQTVLLFSKVPKYAVRKIYISEISVWTHNISY